LPPRRYWEKDVVLCHLDELHARYVAAIDLFERQALAVAGREPVDARVFDG